jgi:hypothetical protein
VSKILTQLVMRMQKTTRRSLLSSCLDDVDCVFDDEMKGLERSKKRNEFFAAFSLCFCA